MLDIVLILKYVYHYNCESHNDSQSRNRWVDITGCKAEASEWEEVFMSARAREKPTSADVACKQKGAGMVDGARGEHSSGARRHASPTPVQHRHERRLF